MRNRSASPEEVRRDIQEIDRTIHDLLMRRAEFVEDAQAAGLLSAVPVSAFRAARILRNILARHAGRMPLRAIVQIWSDILFGPDTTTTLHVFAGDDASGFWDLARTHFGCTMPLIAHATATGVVHACGNDPCAMGLVPSPESGENGQTWWEQLAPAGHAGPRIAQSLPFVRNDGGRVPLPQGFVISAIEQEATGSDTSILRLGCHSEMSRARLQAVMRQAGFDSQIIAACRESPKSPASRVLVANKGFVATGDERLAAVVKIAAEAIESLSLVGGFADPFEAPA